MKRVNERDSLEKDIAALSAALADPKKIDGIIITELKDIIKKHGKDRRTEIVRDAVPVPPAVDLVEDYPLRLFLTAHSYLKKIPLTSLRMSGEHYLKDGDTIIQELECSNKTELLLFSDKQNVYKIKCHEIADCKTSSMGEFTVNLLDSAEGERIVYMTSAGDYTGFMLFAFNNGKIAKVSMEVYATKQNRRKLINAYSDKAALVFAAFIPEDADFMAMRNADKALLFNTGLINPVTTKNSIGVQVFTLKKNSSLSQVITAEQAAARFADTEYYRVDSIPSAGHFLSVKDK
jgi:DNA gyrase subunit A